MNGAKRLFKTLTRFAVVGLVLATAILSWAEDGSRDTLSRTAQDAGAVPSYHLGAVNLGRADAHADNVPGALFAQAGGSSGATGGDSGQANSVPQQGNLSEIGHKLTNPVSNVWALFTEFDLFFSDGDVNRGDSKVGGRMLVEPVLPIPLYGPGQNTWKFIVRPTIPVIFSQPVPNGLDHFNNLGGLGDSTVVTMVSPPAGSWILGLGPTWLFPTATHDALGRQQWGVGPAAAVGYATKEWTAFVFPQQYWGIGGWNKKDTPNASFLNLIYSFIYNLPDGWQVGTNPTITYDNKASSGNKWNVPVGLTVSKMTKIGDVPTKFQLAMEYSVVGQDAFGQVAQIKLNIIPVIKSLIRDPIFGGM